jgi:triosephosphate isomerase
LLQRVNSKGFALDFPRMRRKLVAGNWKMHGSRHCNDSLLSALREGVDAGDAECAVLVPAPYLAQAEALLSGSAVAWGAQNVSEHASGAFTGEVSAAMVAEFGARYAIVGHSERRVIFGESSETVARKMLAVRKSGLVPMVCVGEQLSERESGLTRQVIAAQLAPVLAAAAGFGAQDMVLAYEPVWAIGTGRTASPEQAQEVHAFIRESVAREVGDAAAPSRILYGGSVKACNAKALFAMPDVDGGLVGGASLVAAEFLDIVRAASAAA